MATNKEKNILDSVIYSYNTEDNQLEEENKLLKETVKSLKDEVEKFHKPPLMVCELNELLEDKAIIRIPNGTEFFVNVHKPELAENFLD